ncbi:MAG TPA: AAA family ATPase [Bryobacteraceae bacterium]|nr:AAA family ATPase [Bryobacteraceae bacterium]
MAPRQQQIRALLVAPHRGLAEQFISTTARTRAFDVLANLDEYPLAQVLEGRIRQYRPEVLLIDVATDLDTASNLIRHAASLKPAIPVIGLHTHNDSDAILRSLRFGACEFLFAPFEVSIQEAALARIHKVLQPGGGPERERGRVIVFSSVKPGSGASTLAVQTAYAIRRATNRRVLVADLDLLSGSTSFLLNATHEQSIVDLLDNSERVAHENWSAATTDADGIDLLPSPEMPYVNAPSGKRISEIVNDARSQYDWTVLDLPTVFTRLSLMSISESDRAFLVATSELASLHLARRAVKMLTQLGIEPAKYQVLINRLDDRNELSTSDLGKLFECRVETSLPDDKLGMQTIVSRGAPLEADSELGRVIDSLTGKLMGALPARKAPAAGALYPSPAFSQS